MDEIRHFKALENMYTAAPINRIYCPTISVSEGSCEIEMEISEQYHHSAGAVHGSVYFKMLDDAAFFAANSCVRDAFVLTKSFTTDFLRPVVEGKLKAVGEIASRTKSRFFAESVIYDGTGRTIGKGRGVFVRSRWPLSQAKGYET